MHLEFLLLARFIISNNLATYSMHLEFLLLASTTYYLRFFFLFLTFPTDKMN
jgi:hypothetical protein